MLGREINTPIELIYALKNQESSDPDSFVQELERELKEAHNLAREHLRTEIVRTKKDYDVKAYKYSFKRGDVVLLLNKGVKKGQCAKLTMPWKNPGIIMKVMSPCTYQVQIGSWDFKICHHDSLKVIQEEEEHLPKWLIKIKKSLQTGEPITYCYCKQPDDGGKYIECMLCKDWFHVHCAGITNTNKIFKCKNCK